MFVQIGSLPVNLFWVLASTVKLKCNYRPNKNNSERPAGCHSITSRNFKVAGPRRPPLPNPLSSSVSSLSLFLIPLFLYNNLFVHLLFLAWFLLLLPLLPLSFYYFIFSVCFSCSFNPLSFLLSDTQIRDTFIRPTDLHLKIYLHAQRKEW